MDERIYTMNLCKTLPLRYLMLTIYPNLYAIHNLDDKVRKFFIFKLFMKLFHHQI